MDENRVMEAVQQDKYKQLAKESHFHAYCIAEKGTGSGGSLLSTFIHKRDCNSKRFHCL